MMCDVCCLLRIECSSLCGACCSLCGRRWSWFVVRALPKCYRMCVAGCLLCAVCCFGVCYLFVAACCFGVCSLLCVVLFGVCLVFAIACCVCWLLFAFVVVCCL